MHFSARIIATGVVALLAATSLTAGDASANPTVKKKDVVAFLQAEINQLEEMIEAYLDGSSDLTEADFHVLLVQLTTLQTHLGEALASRNNNEFWASLTLAQDAEESTGYIPPNQEDEAKCNNGFGNNDNCVPGNSWQNNAENTGAVPVTNPNGMPNAPGNSG